MRTPVPLALIVLALATGCGQPEPPAPEAGPATAVSLARATLTDLASTSEAGGVVRARLTARVASRVLAPVAEVHVRPGDHVAVGARLVSLDAAEFEAHRARAIAAQAAAVSTVTAAAADVQAAQAGLALARLTHERVEALAAKRSATREELDRAIAGLRTAEAAGAAAEARHAAARAASEAAHAAAEAAAITLSYAALTAPFGGVVTERHVDPGSMAAPGQPLLTLEGIGDLRLEVEIDEARAVALRVGQDVEVRVDAVFADWRPARIVEIARVDAASHAFVVKVGLPPDESVRSGMFGRARLAGAPRRVLAMPTRAIVRRGQLTFAFVASDGLARLRSITVGQTTGDLVEVLAGLTDGDQVVLDPPDGLPDGVRIAATTSPSSASAP